LVGLVGVGRGGDEGGGGWGVGGGGVKCPVWIVGWRRLSGFAVRGLKSDECDSWRLKYGLIPKIYG